MYRFARFFNQNSNRIYLGEKGEPGSGEVIGRMNLKFIEEEK